jgi:hypothetical protein
MMTQQMWELIRDQWGNREWVLQGERFLVIVQHNETRPLHIYPAATQADAEAMVNRAHALHQVNNDECLVHYWTAAQVIGRVRSRSEHGSNGRIGRSRSLKSLRREQCERAALDGTDRLTREQQAERKKQFWANLRDDPTLLGRLNGTYAIATIA